MNIKDKMFWNACQIAKVHSRCRSRQIGSVLVKDDVIAALGWNGPPEGILPCNEGWYFDRTGKKIEGCPRYDMGFKSGQGLEHCIAVHSERSCLIHAAKKDVPAEGGILYMTCGIPCKDCMVEIIEAGIKEIVVTDKNGFYDEQSKYLLENSNLKVREWDLDE